MTHRPRTTEDDLTPEQKAARDAELGRRPPHITKEHLMSRSIRGHAQYNNKPDTRPTGTGGIRDYDPKRPGGDAGTGPYTGDHDFNSRPAQKRWPHGRG